MELCDRYMHEIILLNPTINDFIKMEKYNKLRGKFPSFLSKEYDKKEENINKKYLNLLKIKNHKTFYDKLLYEDLKEYFDTLYFKDEYFPLSHLDNFFIDFMTTINSKDSGYDFSDVNSYKDYITRLRMCKKLCNHMINRMKVGIDKKMTISRIIVQSVIRQLQELLVNNTYEDEFNHYRKIPPSIKDEFLDTIESYLISSIKKIIKFLIDDYIDRCRTTIGLSGLKDGKKLYRDIIKSYTYEDYTPEMIHKLGFKEIKVNMAELNKLQKDMKFKGDYGSFIIHMRDIPSSKLKDKTEVLQELESIKERLLKEVFDKYFDDTILKKDHYKIKCVPKEDKHTSAYYQLSDFNNVKKGTFYINALNPSLVNKHELPVLSLHEGIPGHHYETNLHMSTDKPLFYRLSDYTCYTEGWGLYCESLLEPKNNYEYFWQIIYNLHRSIRLVIDSGIHYHGWSYEKSFQFMKQYLPYTDDQIKNEIYRYICDPGQAITYKVGELFFLRLRDDYFRKKKVDYKEFHKLILRIGPCPLKIVEEQFNEYV